MDKVEIEGKDQESIQSSTTSDPGYTLIRRMNIFSNLGVVVFFVSLHTLIERSVQQTVEPLIRSRCDISSGSVMFAYDVQQKDMLLIWKLTIFQAHKFNDV